MIRRRTYYLHVKVSKKSFKDIKWFMTPKRENFTISDHKMSSKEKKGLIT